MLRENPTSGYPFRMSIWDVIVIGAGPAGASVAWRLAGLGHGVLLLEKERLPRSKPCGGGLSPQVGAWFDFDFSPVISDRASRFRFTWKGADPVEVEIPSEQALWLVRREVFDTFLVRQAQAKGAELRESCPSLGLYWAGDHWEVETSWGRLGARYVVAADGARGTTARALGFTKRRRAVAGALEAEHPRPPREPGLLHLDFGGLAKGYLWNFPKADGQSLGGGLFRGGGEGPLRDNVEHYVAGFGLDWASCSVAAHPILLWDGDQALHTRQALLVGEAACVVDPLTAEGLRPSIRTGLLAAEVLDEVLRSRELRANPSALEAYTRRVREELGLELAWARRLAQVFYRAPALGYRLGVKHPGAAERMAQLLCGELRYSDVARRALLRIGAGLLE